MNKKCQILEYNSNNIDFIASEINKGKICCFPTDTLYAISSIASNKESIKKIYDIKKRDYNKPLSVFIYDIKQVYNIANITDKKIDYINQFWPGKYSFILPYKTNNLVDRSLINQVNNSISVRMPNYELVTKIMKKINGLLINTSANFSNENNISNINDLIDIMGTKVDYIIYDNNIVHNEGSTIISMLEEQPITIR